MAVSKIKVDLAPTEEVTKNIYLSQLTWYQGTAGMYYATAESYQKKVISAFIQDFASLKATDNVTIMVSSSNNLWLMANTNSFNQAAEIVVHLFLRG